MRENVQIKGLIPIGVQRLLDHGGGVSLLAAYRGDGERIRMSCRERYQPLILVACRLRPYVRNTSRLYNPSAAMTRARYHVSAEDIPMARHSRDMAGVNAYL